MTRSNSAHPGGRRAVSDRIRDRALVGVLAPEAQGQGAPVDDWGEPAHVETVLGGGAASGCDLRAAAAKAREDEQGEAGQRGSGGSQGDKIGV
eukprot:759154-Hanusia_phi.AAC.2